METKVKTHRPLFTCWRCGIGTVITQGRRCHDCAQLKEWQVQEHLPEVTAMRNGKYRAECECGWWTDWPTVHEALKDCTRHVEPDPPCGSCLEWIVRNDPAKYQSTATYLKAAQKSHQLHKGGEQQ